jgi:hypothetical protein
LKRIFDKDVIAMLELIIFCMLLGQDQLVSCPVPTFIKFNEYPQIAAIAKDSGDVSIRFEVDPQGKPCCMAFAKGNERLFPYCKFVLEGWSFEPVDLGGKKFVMNFSLELISGEARPEASWQSPNHVRITGKTMKINN